MSRAIELAVGQRFGMLVVLARAPNKGRFAAWACRCDCGDTKDILGASLHRGSVQSCGCARYSIISAKIQRHGHARVGQQTPEYKAWCKMIWRCNSRKSNRWERYGGRGIGVCARWRGSFENFLADMGPKPSPTHSIDRIDNDRWYEPGNCRWATRSEQRRNRSDGRRFNFQGRLLLLGELAEASGISRNTLKDRVRRGWTEEDLTKAVRG